MHHDRGRLMHIGRGHGHDGGQRVAFKAPAGLLCIERELERYSVGRNGGGWPVCWEAHFVSARRLHPWISAANRRDGDGQFLAGLRGGNVGPSGANILLIVLSV